MKLMGYERVLRSFREGINKTERKREEVSSFATAERPPGRSRIPAKKDQVDKK